MADRGTELLQSVEEEVREEALRLFLSRNLLQPAEREAVADALAIAVANYLAISWGGTPVYIPKDNKRRAAMMVREFTGDNHADLARKFGVCIHTVYNAIKQDREARMGKKLQPGNLLDYI